MKASKSNKESWRNNTDIDYPWNWQTGEVDTSTEHIKILYGDLNKVVPKDLVLAALLSAPEGYTFTVQFLIDEIDDKTKHIAKAVKCKLDYILLGLRKKDPWAYAIYHCSTASNIYSAVHWSYYQKNSNSGARD